MNDEQPKPQHEELAREPSKHELTQEELAARYLEQQRRMRCPSCGEQEEYF